MYHRPAREAVSPSPARGRTGYHDGLLPDLWRLALPDDPPADPSPSPPRDDGQASFPGSDAVPGAGDHTLLADGRSVTTEELTPLVYDDLRRMAAEWEARAAFFMDAPDTPSIEDVS